MLGKERELNMIHSSADWTKDTGRDCSLQEEKWGKDFKLGKDGFQLHIKEELPMTEMNSCLGGRGGFFSKEKFKYFSRNCVWVPCLQMEKSQSCRLTNSSSLFLVFKVLSHVSISAA